MVGLIWQSLEKYNQSEIKQRHNTLANNASFWMIQLLMRTKIEEPLVPLYQQLSKIINVGSMNKGLAQNVSLWLGNWGNIGKYHQTFDKI